MKNNNTLSPSVTSTFFLKEDGYTNLVAAWKAAVNDKKAPFQPSSAELLAYAILRGKDWRKGFTPITRERKLSSGSFAVNDGASRSLYSLRAAFRSEIFAPFVHADAYSSIEKLIDLAATRNLLMAGNAMEEVLAYPGQRVMVAA
jgi:hypothetical protein